MRKELSDEQKRIQEEARTLVKILGLLEGLSNSALTQVKEAAQKKMSPQPEDVQF